MRHTNYWWDAIGDFPPADERALCPDPGSVIKGYQHRKQVSLRDLADELHLTEKMVRLTIAKNAGLDSITRRRFFVARLAIPPVLLGLDALHAQAPASWWIKEGYPPFDAENDGYPNPGQVIKCYREQTLKTLPDGVQKPWTQSDLSQAFDPPLSEITVNKMEKHNIGLDSMTRRQAVTFMLSIPPALMGLDGLAHEQSIAQHAPSIYLPKNYLDSTLLTTYRSEQTRLFADYYMHHGQDAIGEVSWWIKHLRENIAPLATEVQLPGILAILACYHNFITATAREQRDNQTALLHANAAVSLAQESEDNELMAVALLWRAEALREQNRLTLAVEDITGARSHAKHASLVVRGQVDTEAGLILALAAQTGSEMSYAFGLFDQAARLIQSQRGNIGEDTYFLKLDGGFYHLRRAMALTTYKSPTGLDDSLNGARRLTGPELTRRRLIIDVVEAQGMLSKATLARGPIAKEQCYAEATRIATDALAVAKQIQSRLNRDRIEGIYQQLKVSPYGNNPAVIRLGWMLQTW